MRIATRLGTKLVSADFNSREYYTNIRKAITAGYFMQARPGSTVACNAQCADLPTPLAALLAQTPMLCIRICTGIAPVQRAVGLILHCIRLA